MIITNSYLGAEVKSVECVKASVGWGVVLMTKTKVPLAYCMSCVASFLEVLGHDVDVCSQAGRHQRLNEHVLAPYSEDG